MLAREVSGEQRAIGARGALALLVTALVALVPAALLGSSDGIAPILEPELAYAAADAPCGGEAMAEPDRVITGEFERSVEGSYVMLPFGVPAGPTACGAGPAAIASPGRPGATGSAEAPARTDWPAVGDRTGSTLRTVRPMSCAAAAGAGMSRAWTVDSTE